MRCLLFGMLTAELLGRTFAVQVTKDNADLLALEDLAAHPADLSTSQSAAFDADEEDDGMEELAPDEDQNPLRIFLASCMLSTDANDDKDQDKNNRVTISTVHSAKGCEWPCVFVCAVESGIFPFYRCVEPKEVDEERCVP